MLAIQVCFPAGRMGGGGGGVQSDTPLISKNIQAIDMKLGMSDKCPIYFQLSVVTWHLICCHGNHIIMTSLVAAILDFQIFNFFIYKFKH